MDLGEPTPPPKAHFLVVGLMVTAEFQQCQFLVTKLHAYYPDRYSPPQIRPMLNVDWTEHLLKIRRQHGGDLWKLAAPVAVFLDGRFLGDHATLAAYIATTYTINLMEDFEALGKTQLMDHFRKHVDLGRHFVTLTFNIGDHQLGTVLLMLYTDLVPHTCRFFLRRCRMELWTHAQIVRIVRGSWVQFAGTETHQLHFGCENYALPHDRRGVVSLCNHRRQVFHTSDFHISLAAAPWMDHKYVAFGLVVQGEEVLAKLENLPTNQEVPVTAVEVGAAQEFVPDEPAPHEPMLVRDRKRHLTAADEEVKCPDEVLSMLDEEQFRQGQYYKMSDMVSHMPFLHLPDRLLAYLKEQEVRGPVEEGDVEPPKWSQSSTLTSISSTDRFVNRSMGFLARSREDLLTLADHDATIRE